MKASRLLIAFPLLAPLAAAGDSLLDSTSRSYHTGDQVLSDAYRPEGMACADLDGDGDPDLALAHYGNFIQPKMSVMRNLGDGSFGAPVTYATAGETTDVVAADLDADGDVDLAFAQSDIGSSGTRVLVFRNHGDGTFAPQQIWTTGKGPTGIATLDADQDGDLDLVTANNAFGENDLSVLYNDGAGGFGTRVDFAVPGLSPYKVAAGDLDGDGAPDLAVTVRAGQPAVQLLFNDGAGAFGAPVPYTAGYPYVVQLPGIAVADVDLDGDLDVLYSTDADQGGLVSSVALFRNQGNGVLSPSQPLATTIAAGPAHDFAVADVTLDGWPDVLCVAYSSDYGYSLIPSLGNGAFGPATSFRTGESARAICAADAEGDGDRDAIVADSSSLKVTVHENEEGRFSMPPVVPTGAITKESDVADVDLDGDLDLVTCDSTVYVLRNQGGGSFGVESFATLSSTLDYPKLRDMNGDGYPDLLMLKNITVGQPPYNLYTTLNQGDGTFGPVTSWPLGSSGTGDLDTLDADQDGDLDVVVTEFLGSPGSDQRKLYLLLNDGNGGLAPPVLIADATITKAKRVVTADVDGDGDTDILSGHNYVVAWLNDGSGSFGAPIVSDSGDSGPIYMTAGDFDGDGNVDVACVCYGATFQGEYLAVLRGYGDGGFRPPDVYYALFSLQYGGLGGLDTLDADGDGDLDLVAGAWGGNDVALFLNAGDGSFAPQQRYGVDGSVTFVRVGDFDGDGLGDVAVNASGGPPLGSAVSFVRGLESTLPSGVSSYCFCASGLPCANSDAGAGCANSTGAGALLTASGSTSVAADDLVLSTTHLPPNLAGLVFMGPNAIEQPFGDGIRCVGGGVFRFPVRNSGPAGAVQVGPIVGLSHASLPPAAHVQVGQTWRFQHWYRDPQGPCDSTFNTSNALAATFQP